MAFLPTKHLRVHMNSFKCVRVFQIELEFGSVGFWGEGKTGVPGEKPLGARERTNNKFNPHMASVPGFEPGPYWWEASASHHCATLAPQRAYPDCFLLETAQRRISLIIVEKHLLVLTAYRVALTQLHAIKTLDSPLACRAPGPCSYVS